MGKKRIIFFDIDGTLYNYDTKGISTDTRRALNRLTEYGYEVCIATGRDPYSIPKEIKEAADWRYYVCSAGHLVLDHNFRILYKKTFPTELVLEIIEMTQKLNMEMELKTTEGRLAISEIKGDMKAQFDEFQVPYPKVEQYKDQEIVSILLFPDGRPVDSFQRFAEITMHINGKGMNCDIGLKGITKLTGIEKVLELSGYREYIAVGDSKNDIEMLEHAEIGAAMGNADNDVKKMADIIIGNIADGGIGTFTDYLIDNDMKGAVK